MKSKTQSIKPIRCFAHRHMTPTEYALYEIAQSKSRKTGKLIFSSRKMVNEFGGGIKKTALNDAAKSLTNAGWFTRLNEGEDGANAEYRVVTHAEWIVKYSTAQCHSNEVSAPTDTSVRLHGHQPAEMVSAKRGGGVREMLGGCPPNEGEVSAKQGEVSAAKCVTVTKHDGIEALTSINLYKQPLNTNLSLTSSPPGPVFANESPNAGQDSRAQASTGSAPDSGAVRRTPEKPNLYADNDGAWLDTRTHREVSWSEALRRFALVGLRFSEGSFYEDDASGTMVPHKEAWSRIKEGATAQ